MDAFKLMMRNASSAPSETAKKATQKKPAAKHDAPGQLNLFDAFKIKAPAQQQANPSSSASSGDARAAQEVQTVSKKRPARRRKNAVSSSSSEKDSGSECDEGHSLEKTRARPRRPRRAAVSAGVFAADDADVDVNTSEPPAVPAEPAPEEAAPSRCARVTRVTLRRPPAPPKPTPTPRPARKAREQADEGGGRAESSGAVCSARRPRGSSSLWSRLSERELRSGAIAAVAERTVARVGSLALVAVLAQTDPSHAVVQPYTVHVDDACTLLAAGGAKGLVALYRLPAHLRFDAADAFGAAWTRGEDEAVEEAREAEVRERVVEAAGVEEAHDRWVSEVQLVRPAGEARPLLLTASDDATVALWDLRRLLDDRGGWSGEAPLRCAHRVSHLHTAGIYSLHAHGPSARVVTSSKDGTATVSRLTSAGLVLERALGEVHAGVVKRVRWRPTDGLAHVFASCGNDKSVQVLDARAAEAVVMRVEGAHTLAVNTVAWNPSRDHLLLSSSFDNSIQLYDVRLGGARSRLSGDSFPLWPARCGRAQSIMHPAFYLDGRAVLAPVDRQAHLQLYATDTGAPLAALPVGYTPSALYAHPSSLLACCKGARLELLRPVLHL